MATDKNTPTPINPVEVEQRAREIVEAKLAEKRADEMLKSLRDEGENLMEKAAGGLSNFASRTSTSLKQWKEERKEMREERAEKERAAEIARERMIAQYRDEARRQLEQERLDAEQSEED